MKNSLIPRISALRFRPNLTAITIWAFLIIMLVGTLLTKLYSYLLFRSIAEMFSIIVAFGIFVIAWNSDPLVKNGYLLTLGVGSLFVAGIDALHMWAYKGMGVFTSYDVNLPTQLWLAARYLQAFLLLIAPFFLQRKVNKYLAFIALATLMSLLLASIFVWEIFPTAYIENVGLTPFKIISEYVIIAILIVAAGLLWQNRSKFDSTVMSWLISSLVAAIAAEFAFIHYIGVADAANLVGHVFKIIEFYLLYRALVETGFMRPYNLILRQIKQDNADLMARENSTFEAISDLISFHDTNYKLVKVNRAFADFFGRKQEELVGKYCYEVFYGADELCPNCPFAEATQMGHSVTEEMNDPRLRSPLLISVSPLFDNNGQLMGGIHIAKDTTERKHAEEALRASEERFRDLYENAPNAYFSVGVDGFINRCNRRAGELLGYTVNDLIERPVIELYADTPHGKEKAARILQRFQAGGAVRDEELEMQRADGNPVWISLTVDAARNSDGQIIESRSMVMDITERKRAEDELRTSEEKFRAIIEQSSEGVTLIDEAGLIVEWNQTSEKMTGIKREQVIDLPLWDMAMMTISPKKQTPQYYEFFKNTVLEALKTGQSYLFAKPVEAEFYPTSGSEKRYLHQTIFPIKTEKGYRVASLTHDITERKQTEIETNELAAIVQSSEDAIIGKTLDGVITSWNKGAEKIYGFTENEMIGQPISDLVPPDCEDELAQILNKIKSGEYIEHYETVRRRKDGRLIHVSLAVSPIRDSEGRIIAASTIGRDITEHKQAEVALQEKQNLLLEAQHIAHIGNWWQDLTTGELFWSDEFFKILGRESQKPTPEPGLAWIHPDDLHILQTAIEEAAAGKKEHDHEFRIVRPDGETRWIHNRWVGIYDKNGKELKRVGTHQDITERKRAEEEVAQSLEAEKKAREVADILRDANVSLSRTLNLEDVLNNLLQYLNHLVPYDSANVMLLEDDFQLRVFALRSYEYWTDIDATRNIKFDLRTTPVLNKVVTTQKTLRITNTLEYSGWVRPAGAEHVLSWFGVPIITNGQVIGLYSVDKAEPGFFTEEHCRLAEGLAGQAAVAIQNARLHAQIKCTNVELEQHVKDRTFQLEAANKELEAFAYSVSHDLRAPLRHIDGFIELLQKKTRTSLDEQSQHYMEVISDSARQMGTLIDDLLSFSRMGRNEMSTTQIDLGDLIKEVILEFTPEVEGRKIEWNIATLPSVMGDRPMLRIVLNNLISNALKFTRSREHSKIEIDCIQENPGETVFFIRDNGVGFEMEYADKLFGVFQRLHRQEDFEGTGIGLANVRRIISRHGGRTWAEGDVDHGATFYFSLPTLQQEPI